MTGTFPLAIHGPVDHPFNYDCSRREHARYVVEMMGKFDAWEIFRYLREAVTVPGELSRNEGLR